MKGGNVGITLSEIVKRCREIFRFIGIVPVICASRVCVDEYVCVMHVILVSNCCIVVMSFF